MTATATEETSAKDNRSSSTSSESIMTIVL